MKFYVSQEKIDRAEHGGASTCPIALTLKEKFPGKTISVAPHNWYNLVKIDDDFYELSPKGAEFVEDFNDGVEVSPTHLNMHKVFPL